MDAVASGEGKGTRSVLWVYVGGTEERGVRGRDWRGRSGVIEDHMDAALPAGGWNGRHA